MSWNYVSWKFNDTIIGIVKNVCETLVNYKSTFDTFVI